MSVRHSLLAILEVGPVHGYGLKSRFEEATGDVWPLNVGQVYTTLGRLERDGLVGVDVDEGGQKTYHITEDGRAELRRWFSTPVARATAPRQELTLKLVFAARSGRRAVADVVRRQQVVTGRSLEELVRVRATAEDAEVGSLLVLEALILQTEAEMRWLQRCEDRLGGGPGPR